MSSSFQGILYASTTQRRAMIRPSRTRPSKNGATILDIAKKVGVSAMTVSRALTGSKEVSETTRQRVLECAAALGYRPNRWARSLVTSRSSIIGVIIPDISHSYFAEITGGIEEMVEKTGYDLLLCHSGMDPARERAEIDTLIGSRVDGLIIASEQPEDAPESFAELKKRKIPFVLIDRFFADTSFPSVRVDDEEVGRLATRCLIDLGHKRIGYIHGRALSPASLRHRGYRDALKEGGIAYRKELIESGNFDIQSGREAMKRLLQLKSPPTAVFAANDPMAIGAVYACRDAGLDVPLDISIVGAGNIEGAHHPNPFLTTVDWPRGGYTLAWPDRQSHQAGERQEAVHAGAADSPVDGSAAGAIVRLYRSGVTA
jgi:LacI family transcriptional regulator